MTLLNSIASTIAADSVANFIDTTATTVAEEAVSTTTTTSLSIWDLCLEGGFIMIPLAILSVVTMYIFIERAIAIHKASKYDPDFMKRIKDYVCEGEI